MSYNFTAQWLKGAKNEAADALSRHPLQPPDLGDDLAEYDIDTNDSQIVASQALSIAQIRASTLLPPEQENLHLQELRRHANEDPIYIALKGVLKRGFPNQKSSLPQQLKVVFETISVWMMI